MTGDPLTLFGEATGHASAAAAEVVPVNGRPHEEAFLAGVFATWAAIRESGPSGSATARRRRIGARAAAAAMAEFQRVLAEEGTEEARGDA